MNPRISDLGLAFDLADIADGVTLKLWSPQGVQSKIKADGTHVTTADCDAEIAIRQALGTARPDDGFIGEEIGSRPSRRDKTWHNFKSCPRQKMVGAKRLWRVHGYMRLKPKWAPNSSLD